MRGCLLFLITSLFVAPATLHAERSLLGANNVSFTIQDTLDGSLTAPIGSFDRWPLLCIQRCAGEGCGECDEEDLYQVNDRPATTALSGREVVMAEMNLAGLSVRRRIYVPAAGQALADGFIRYLDSFRNDGNQPVTVRVTLGSSMLRGAFAVTGSQLWRSANDDNFLTEEDRWLLVDDAEPNGGSPAIAVLTHGAAGVVPAQQQQRAPNPNRADHLSWRFDEITVPPSTTFSLVTFIVAEPAQPPRAGIARDMARQEVMNLLQMRLVDALFGVDEALRRSIINVDVEPENAAPLAELEGPYNGPENELIALSGQRSYDAEGEPLTYRWDLDGDGAFDDAEGANAFARYPDDGQYPIALEVTDPRGKRDVDRTRVTVRNVAPTVIGIQSDSPIDEGRLLRVSVEASDPGDQASLSYRYDWEGSGEFIPGLAEDSHRYPRDGVYSALVEVRDDDGGVDIEGFEVLVRNRAPAIQQLIATNPAEEGSEVLLRIQAFDQGEDPLTYYYDFDGDSVDAPDLASAIAEGLFEASGPGLSEATFRFPDDGNFSGRFIVADDQGAQSERLYEFSIFNAPPQLEAIELPLNAEEGQLVPITVTATDPGSGDRLSYGFDLDDVPGFEVVQDEPTYLHRYPDDGFFGGIVAVFDDDGAEQRGDFEIEVENLPPVGEFEVVGERAQDDGVVITVEQGRSFELIAAVVDPSEIDQRSLRFHWDLNDDGIFERLDAGARQQLRFDEEGIYPISCRILDKDFGELILSREVWVSGRLPEDVRLETLDEGPFGEGSAVRFRVNARDPDPLLYSFDFDDDGAFELEEVASPIVSHRYPDEGTYRARVVVIDPAGEVDATVTVEVENVAPEVEIRLGPPVGEGEPLRFSLQLREPGDDRVQLRWSTGETPLADGEEVELAGGDSLTVELPTSDNGLLPIRAQATDEDGATGPLSEVDALIENRPPFVPLFVPPPAREGEPYRPVIPADDPAGLEDTLSFALLDPPPGIEMESFTGRLLWTPTYEDFLASPISLAVIVEDEDGGRLELEISIDVLPRDADEDGIPDTYEEQSCERSARCLDSADPEDAAADPDEDGRSSLEEWLAGTDPFVYEGPTTPVPEAPLDGARLADPQPELVATIAENSLVGAETRYLFELYGDEALEELLAASEPLEAFVDEEQIRWEPAPESFREDSAHWWRVRAVSGPAESPWSEVQRFWINADNRRPTTPQLQSPSDESVVDATRPTLQFIRSEDADGDPIDYVVRIYRETDSEPVLEGGGRVVPDGDEMVLSYLPEVGLQENRRYLWEVVAIDARGLESETSERWLFQVDQENEAPSAPMFIFPEEGSRLDERSPTFSAGSCFDGEGAPVSYHFQVRVVGEEPLDESGPVEPVDGVARWQPAVDLLEDQEHLVSAYCSDGRSDSEVVAITFTVSAENNAPPAPTAISPENGAQVFPGEAAITWSTVFDPEGERVSYEVTYCDGRGDCKVSVRLQDRSFNLSGRIPVGVPHDWSVVAFDESGNSSPPSDPMRITIIESAEEDEGCRSAVSGQTPLMLLLLTLPLLFSRRRDALSA